MKCKLCGVEFDTTGIKNETVLKEMNEKASTLMRMHDVAYGMIVNGKDNDVIHGYIRGYTSALLETNVINLCERTKIRYWANNVFGCNEK